MSWAGWRPSPGLLWARELVGEIRAWAEILSPDWDARERVLTSRRMDVAACAMSCPELVEGPTLSS